MAVMLPPDPLFVIRGEMSSIMCLLMTDHEVYAGTVTGKVHIWSLKNYRCMDYFENSNESCLSLHFCNNETTLLTQDKLGTIRWWQKISVWTKLRELNFDYVGFCKIQLFENSVALPLHGARIKVIPLLSDSQDGDEVCLRTEATIGDLMDFKLFSKNEETLLIGVFDGGHLMLYSLSGKIERDRILLADTAALVVDFDPILMKGLTGGSGANLFHFTVSAQFKLNICKEVALVNEGTAAICVRGDHRLVAVGGWDGRLRLFSWKYLNCLAVLLPHKQTVQAVAFTSSKPYVLCAGCKAGNISIWSLYNNTM